MMPSITTSTPDTTGTTAASGTTKSTQTASSPVDALANKTTFLQLLVAQIKNQNPLNPADGTQFVTQLAQFTTLEQETQTRTDLDAILKTLQSGASGVTKP